MKKLLQVLFLIAASSWQLLYAQTGEITGRVVDEKGEGIPFANVIAERGGAMVTGTTTDFDGYYSLKPLDPGEYDIKVTYLGYNTSIVTDVRVSADKITELNFELSPKVEVLEAVEIVEYKVPLIDKNDQSTKNTITKEEIQVMPTRNVQSIASTSAGVYQSDEGDALNIKGARTDATEYYIDGIKVRGSTALPTSGIEQVTVVTGGVPAKYGDAIGGIVNISTRGPSREFAGEIELSTSHFLDAYDYNLASFNLTGPIATLNKGEDNERTLMGFFVAGEFLYEKDADPSAIGMPKVKDEVMADLQQNPLMPAPDGQGGFILASEALTNADIDRIKYKQNVREYNYRLSGKFDIKATDNINLTFGGSMDYANRHDWIKRYSLLNPENNPLYRELTWRVFGRFTQKFPERKVEEGEKPSAFQNAYYTVQVDYTRVYNRFEDEDYGFSPFEYGYIGKYITHKQPIFQYATDSITGKTGWLLVGYQDTLVEFIPGTINPLTTRYTEKYYELAGAVFEDGKYTAPEAGAQDGFYETLDQIALGNGLRNGDRPNSHITYDMWYNSGRQFNGYGIQADNEQFSVNVAGSVDILRPGASKRNKHALEFGFTFEQRIDRRYQISPVGLWTLMRQLANRHIQQLDKSNPILVIDGVEYAWNDPNAPTFGDNDTILYNRKYVASDQSWFDRNLRLALGMPVNSTELINIDELDPSTFDLSMFNADELLNEGNPYVFYYGYDYLGNRLSGKVAFEDFFKEKDEFGNFTRKIGAFRPIYTAAYLQDQFYFKDLAFNIGVRIDRFDANQKVLRDRYSLYGIKSAEEVAGEGIGDIPSNIGPDYAVYVDDFHNPTRILGFRDGDVWYNERGEEITDPSVIAKQSSTGQITPYLINPDDDIKSEEFDPNLSFKDYEPQITVMPRIQFSFNLTDEASFFAHYDVLTQRPQSRIISTPDDWYFFEENVATVINNPNLKPERTIDYQVGFRQRVSKTSAITISAFYRELKDMIQVKQINYAYPRNYTTFSNEDFGTVKGMSVSYDLRRTRNVTMKVNYTLQFAEGTGSNSTSQLNLVGSGQPNLRTIVPLDYDARHTVNLILDYSFGEGNDYNGPRWGGKEILSNFGVNFNIRARSGTPYTQNTKPIAEAFLSTVQRSTLKGKVNGARMPAHFRIDLRVYKDFKLRFKDEEGEKSKRPLYLNLYLRIQNLLNTKNVVRVYPYTGSPSDDGYLTSAEGQQNIEQQTFPQSFIDLYRWAVDDPDNYARPRTIRLGAIFKF